MMVSVFVAVLFEFHVGSLKLVKRGEEQGTDNVSDGNKDRQHKNFADVL